MKIYEITNYDIEDKLSIDPKMSKIGLEEFTKVYPNVNINANGTELSTGSDYGRNAPDFFITYSPMIEGNNSGILVDEAYSGKYKGVVRNIVNRVAKYVNQQAPGTIPTLFIESDESGGAWKSMADSLGLEYKLLD